MTLPAASCEVAIIGAGPAGATLAYELLQGGLKPLILDKAAFPRIKVCAGGLTIKTFKFLPPDLSPVLEDEIRRVQLSFNLGRTFTKAWHQPLLYTVERQRFDAFLMERVRQAGGEFGEGERLEKITPGPGDSCILITSRRVIKAQVVVGSRRRPEPGGSETRVCNPWISGIWDSRRKSPGLMRKSPPAFTGTIYLDMGTMADGYAWIFPRGEVLLIGVGGPLHQGPQLKRYHARLLSHLGLGAHAFPWRATSFPTG